MSDRKAELERKKARLQAMRDEKKRKEDQKKKESETSLASHTAPSTDLRHETEQMLADLGIPPSGNNASATPARPSALVAPPGSSSGTSPSFSSQRKKLSLTTSQVTQTNIPPREMVSYSKETQTPFEQYAERTEAIGVDSKAKADREKRDDDNDSMEVGTDTPPSSAHTHKKMPHVEKPTDTAEDKSQAETKDAAPLPPPVRELTEEEKHQIIASDDFMRFFDRTTRVIERALEEVDVCTDYTGGDGDKEEGGLAEGEKLKLNRQFFDERWSKHRIVTSLDWSVQYPELLVSSYNNNEEAINEPDGVALIWNLKFKKNTPEYIFHCQSAVMSSCFAKFHPNLIVGGTYSGQIVLWDNRSNKKTPVQRTPLSASAHTHPVYCVNVVGTQNAHNLISISNDGKMCSWNLDMLSQPQDSMELQLKQSRAAAVMCSSFLSGDVNNFVVGSEEAAVYTASRHGSKAGISDMFEGHHGPITGIDCHNVPGQIDFSQYFLTSSFDWTVKLWSIKENKPLHSFEDNSDYVYDAKWSPIHPALFATVDGTGRLALYNLNSDTEVPSASTVIDPNVACNKCLWHQSGHHIAVGDDGGRVHLYDVGEPLAQPRQDEWQRLVHTLQDLKTNQAEQDEDAMNFGTTLLR